MLRWRLLTAAAILTPLIALLVLDVRCHGGVPGVWLIPGGWLLLLAATHEMLDLLRLDDVRPTAGTAYVGGSLVFLGGCVPAMARGDAPGGSLARLGWIAAALALAAMLALVVEMVRFREPGYSTRRLALSLCAVLYPGFFLALLAQLRFVHGNAWGMAALVSLVFVVKLSDTAAYAAGKLWGRRKMAPRLSPGKTIEGAVGSLVGAAAAAWVFFQWLAPLAMGGDAATTPVWGSLVYGVVVGVAGMVGDLGESLLKRDARRKDSSRWMPGLGGVLDVLDSLLLAAPAALFCWMAGIVGPRA